MRQRMTIGFGKSMLVALMLCGAIGSATVAQHEVEITRAMPSATLICYEFASCGVPLPSGNCPTGVCWDGWIYDCYCGTGWIIGITCPCYG